MIERRCSVSVLPSRAILGILKSATISSDGLYDVRFGGGTPTTTIGSSQEDCLKSAQLTWATCVAWYEALGSSDTVAEAQLETLRLYDGAALERQG